MRSQEEQGGAFGGRSSMHHAAPRFLSVHGFPAGLWHFLRHLLDWVPPLPTQCAVVPSGRDSDLSIPTGGAPPSSKARSSTAHSARCVLHGRGCTTQTSGSRFPETGVTVDYTIGIATLPRTAGPSVVDSCSSPAQNFPA